VLQQGLSAIERPTRRLTSLGLALGFLAALVALLAASHGQAQTADAFRRFVEELWPEAMALGVTRPTFDQAFRGVEPDLSIPDLVLPGQGKSDVKGQAEFTKTPAEYLNAAHLTRLAEQARALRIQHGEALAKIERLLGVQPQFVLAIWGRETAFGTYRLPHYAIKVLATQAYLGRRKDMFRKELLYALKMLQDGVRTRETLVSSWAGAMGLTQFMPSEYYTLAYDLDGDGRKDIWGSVPDALASAANQLREKGWLAGQSWGYEVQLPKTVTCQQEGPLNARPLREWVKMGVARTAARAFPPEALEASAFLLMPAGIHGPAFLALENFLVLKRYNMSDLYALFVGNLGDRIAGGGAFDTPWGDVKQLSSSGIEGIQQRLQALGHPVSLVDGKAGMNTRALIGAYQAANNLKMECWPTQAVLDHMRSPAARGASGKHGDAATGSGGKSGVGAR
jgi:lytic murein transglycosylase